MGPPSTLEESLWDEAYVAWWWLKTFNMPPQMVDEMPAVLVSRIPQINGLFVERENEQRKKQQS